MQSYSTLLNPLGIEHFHYIKVYKDGQYLHLVDHPKWGEYYVANITTCSPAAIQMAIGGFHHFLWPQSDEDFLLKNAWDHNLAHGYSITRFTPEYYEAFSFMAHPQNPQIINSYLQYRQTLERFIYYFHQREHDLLQEGEKYRARFVDLGFDFSLIQQQKKTSIIFPFIYNNKEITLTQQEKECLGWFAKGYGMKEIGKKLKISPRTVESYIQNIKVKFDVHYKADLAEIYWQNMSVNFYK